MVNLRSVMGWLSGAIARLSGVRRSGRVALYAGVGERLELYEVDIAGASLARRGSVTLPALVQYGWPDPPSRFLYVTSSDRGPGAAGDTHHLSAYRIEPATGALQLHGSPVRLRARPIHNTLDIDGTHIVVAYNNPSGLNVYRINPDGTIGAEVQQPAPLDGGIYAHHVRVAPSNRAVILVTRGNDAAGGKPEDPGALKVFGYQDGVLTNRASIAPGGGYGFGPRHLDFHPSQPWVFVSLERQNQLDVFRMTGDTLEPTPMFSRKNLIDPGTVGPRQHVGTVHVHPNGRFVYVPNRSGATKEVEGQRVFAGGENNMAVYALNPATGEPTLIQHIETQGFVPRTFSIDPSGRLLVVANQDELNVREGNTVRTVPASLVTYHIGGDGKLTFAHKYEIDTAGKNLFWMGMVALP